jgi:hypothetical protein
MESVMLKLIITLIASIVLMSPAYASHDHHRHHSHHYRTGHLYVCHGCVVRETKLGKIAVNSKHADNFVGAINALYDAGYRGPLNCAAAGGHVAGSKHYSGDACDLQYGHNRAPKIMYHARTILAKFGLYDGCNFRDCGHIQYGVGLNTRYASHHVKHRYAAARQQPQYQYTQVSYY